MDKEKLLNILAASKNWLNYNLNLCDSDLSCADLNCANLLGSNLRGANLSCADLRYADLTGTDLTGANLTSVDLTGADLRNANLTRANLRNANLKGANLQSANLHDANMRGANLTGANLSGAKELPSAINYMEANFERTSDGYIAYKFFGAENYVPESWKIEKGSIITENVNFNRTDECGCGINVAPLEWVKTNYCQMRNRDLWKVLIRWEWLCGVCVPYNTDGKIRCERVELVDVEYLI